MRISRPELSAASWRRSSHSNAEGGNCLEVADHVSGLVPVRDSKRPHGPAVAFGTSAWTAFVTGLKEGTTPTAA